MKLESVNGDLVEARENLCVVAKDYFHMLFSDDARIIFNIQKLCKNHIKYLEICKNTLLAQLEKSTLSVDPKSMLKTKKLTFIGIMPA